mgnify:CR=1 FL=1
MSPLSEQFNWKYVTLPCPNCQFAHDFKRVCYWDVDGFYVGLYKLDDMAARASCEQHLFYGEVTSYELAKKVIEGGTILLAGNVRVNTSAEVLP